MRFLLRNQKYNLRGSKCKNDRKQYFRDFAHTLYYIFLTIVLLHQHLFFFSTCHYLLSKIWTFATHNHLHTAISYICLVKLNPFVTEVGSPINELCLMVLPILVVTSGRVSNTICCLKASTQYGSCSSSSSSSFSSSS
jgi:hypothetical protein